MPDEKNPASSSDGGASSTEGGAAPASKVTAYVPPTLKTVEHKSTAYVAPTLKAVAHKTTAYVAPALKDAPTDVPTDFTAPELGAVGDTSYDEPVFVEPPPPGDVHLTAATPLGTGFDPHAPKKVSDTPTAYAAPKLKAVADTAAPKATPPPAPPSGKSGAAGGGKAAEIEDPTLIPFLKGDPSDFEPPEYQKVENDSTKVTTYQYGKTTGSDTILPSKTKSGSKKTTAYTAPPLKKPGENKDSVPTRKPALATEQHYGGFRFRVVVAGITEDMINASFSKISGLVSKSEEIEFMHGTDSYVRIAPGRSHFEPVEFERVYNGLDAFYMWRREIEVGHFDSDLRRDVRVELLDSQERVIRTMVLVSAWPIAWEMPDLSADSSAPAIEKFSLACKEIYEDSAS